MSRVCDAASRYRFGHRRSRMRLCEAEAARRGCMRRLTPAGAARTSRSEGRRYLSNGRLIADHVDKVKNHAPLHALSKAGAQQNCAAERMNQPRCGDSDASGPTDAVQSGGRGSAGQCQSRSRPFGGLATRGQRRSWPSSWSCRHRLRNRDEANVDEARQCTTTSEPVGHEVCVPLPDVTTTTSPNLDAGIGKS